MSFFKNKPVFKLLFGLLILVVAAVAFYFYAPDSFKQQLGLAPKINPAYSEHQQKLIKEFGEPDAFKLVTNLEGPRRETWFYYQLGEAFVFEDGQFLARQHQDFDIDDKSELITVKFKPADFYQIKTMNQLTDLTKVEPNFSGEINPKVLNNAQFYSFADALDVGLIDEQVVFIKTHVFQASQGDNQDSQLQNQSSPKPTQTSQHKPATSNQIVTSPDGLFQIDAGGLAAEMTVAVEQPDFAQKLYTFCVQVDDPNLADFFCEGQARPVFTIAAYSFDQFEAQTNSPLYSQETEPTLGTYDDLIYTFSHVNGDVPAEIQGKADRYFQAVRQSFRYLR